MPFPSQTLTTLRPDLGGSLMEFDLLANQQRFVGLRVFPAFEAAEQSGTFGRVTIESLLKSIETSRAPGAGYNRDLWDFEEDSYACREHGVEQPLDDRQARMYRNYFDAETISTRRAQSMVLTAHESRVAALVQASTNTTSAGTVWSDHANATPISNVEAALVAMYGRGVIANAVVITWEAFRNVRQCAQVIERLNGAGAGQRATASDIGEAELALVFGVPNVFVAGGQNFSSGAIGSVWDKTEAHVLRIAETNDIQEPACGRTIHWAEDGSQIGTAVESYRDEPKRSEIVRARMDTDEKLMFPEAIQSITGVLS